MTRFLTLVLITVLLGLTLEVAEAQTKVPAKIGITGVPIRYNETENGWLEVFRRGRTCGVSLLGGSAEWNDHTEPTPGEFRWKALDTYFLTLKKHKYRFKISLDVSGPFWHDQLKKPSHLKAASFAEAKFQRRYLAMLTSLLDRYGNRLSYLVINAEGATTYFRKNPGHLDAYCDFLGKVRRHVKNHSPHLRVGVNTDPHNPDKTLRRMAGQVDYLAFDVASGQLKSPSRVEDLVRRLLKLAKGKKIAFQNAWWSTSKVENTTEAQQKEFVQEVFKILERHGAKMEYVIFYTMFDEDLDFMRPLYAAQFPNLPPAYREKMLQSNGNSGFFRANLKPKPAWHELCRQLKKYR